MQLARYVADWLADNTTGRGYGVTGGARMWLDDAVCHHPRLKFIACHHEQAAAFAAEADARVCGKPSAVHVTAGPGVTNAMTGVACAFADSIPMIIIAGQAELRTLIQDDEGLRQLGISEVHGVGLMAQITKLAVTVLDPNEIRCLLEMALHVAMSDRKGPVYIEIPLDVQNAEISPAQLCGMQLPPSQINENLKVQATICTSLLKKATRPVIVLGNGVRLAGAECYVSRLQRLGVPILCSWSGADLIDHDSSSYVGKFGLIGDRAGNFAIQNADFIMVLGSRLSIPQIGHAWEMFAPDATVAMVDVSQAEMDKNSLRVGVKIEADVGEFLGEFFALKPRYTVQWSEWVKQCMRWKGDYPVLLPHHCDPIDGVNVYQFLDVLAHWMPEDAIVVTDVGMSFVCAHQALKQSGRGRMFHSPGLAPMGYGLPAAVGASMAAPKRKVICLTGDGGAMFNLQELQTIAHHRLPVTIFLYANNGYRTMQTTQGNHFARESAASPASDISWPDYTKIAEAFGFGWWRIRDSRELNKVALALNCDRPMMCVVDISPSMVIEPIVKTKMQDGRFVPSPLHQMYPPLTHGDVADVVDRPHQRGQKILGTG